MDVRSCFRVYKPGNKFDYTIILQGSQGIGKSTFLKLMALDDSWFNDSLDSLDSDKAVQSLTGSWIIELAELKSLARTAGGVESVKRFLTATQDKYRIPYERRADTFYRQCVFAGTTNKDDFCRMKQETGVFLLFTQALQKHLRAFYTRSYGRYKTGMGGSSAYLEKRRSRIDTSGKLYAAG